MGYDDMLRGKFSNSVKEQDLEVGFGVADWEHFETSNSHFRSHFRPRINAHFKVMITAFN